MFMLAVDSFGRRTNVMTYVKSTCAMLKFGNARTVCINADGIGGIYVYVRALVDSKKRDNGARLMWE
jgi:hypothetical protein